MLYFDVLHGGCSDIVGVWYSVCQRENVAIRVVDASFSDFGPDTMLRSTTVRRGMLCH